MNNEHRVVVVTGMGGMGRAIAQRLGSGSRLVLADVDQKALGVVAAELRTEGYEVAEHVTDVSDIRSVEALRNAATDLGAVHALIHTAGLSPTQASVEAILKVDLLGTALMLDFFAPAMAPGGAGVFIASMAGTLFSLDADVERRLATSPTNELLSLSELSLAAIPDPGTAYGIAKRANQLRVRAASLDWGRQGARVNSISPGIISTPMGAAELEGPSGEFMRSVLSASPTARIGTPQDIAAVVEFLVGPNSNFITGTDVLVDGGVVASLLTQVL